VNSLRLLIFAAAGNDMVRHFLSAVLGSRSPVEHVVPGERAGISMMERFAGGGRTATLDLPGAKTGDHIAAEHPDTASVGRAPARRS
jgi:hypothetical protein